MLRRTWAPEKCHYPVVETKAFCDPQARVVSQSHNDEYKYYENNVHDCEPGASCRGIDEVGCWPAFHDLFGRMHHGRQPL